MRHKIQTARKATYGRPITLKLFIPDTMLKSTPPACPKKRRNSVVDQIRLLQNTTGLILPKRPFARLTRQIAHKFKRNLRFTSQALIALQEIAEAYLCDLFRCCQKHAKHAKRIGINIDDIQLARTLVWKPVGEKR